MSGKEAMGTTRNRILNRNAKVRNYIEGGGVVAFRDARARGKDAGDEVDAGSRSFGGFSSDDDAAGVDLGEGL